MEAATMTVKNEAVTAAIELGSGAGKSDGQLTIGTRRCPRCEQKASKSEETEWLVLFTCGDCGWRFATRQARSA
jgi:hypothetical protein